MPKPLTLSVVAPDRSVVEESVVSVVVPGIEGYFGVLAGHVPLIAALRAGLIEYEDTNGQRHYVTVSGGFAEVAPDRVNVLADAAERAQDIDVARAERALDNARKALRGETSGVTSQEATAELERAMNRVRGAKIVVGH
jgi:F-type H+-transporting ATPase subunit epsilon